MGRGRCGTTTTTRRASFNISSESWESTSTMCFWHAEDTPALGCFAGPVLCALCWRLCATLLSGSGPRRRACVRARDACVTATHARPAALRDERFCVCLLSVSLRRRAHAHSPCHVLVEHRQKGGFAKENGIFGADSFLCQHGAPTPQQQQNSSVTRRQGDRHTSTSRHRVYPRWHGAG